MLYLKKFKIILLFSYFCIFVYVLFSFLKKEEVIKEETISFTGRVIELETTETYTKFVVQGKEKIVGYYYGNKNQDILLGQEVMLSGTIKAPEKNRNFYLFNYKNYLKSQKIYKIMTIEEIKITSKQISIYYKMKNAFLNRINHFSKTKQYMLLFLYGENTLEESLRKQYQNIGIQHLFAISGMHILFFKNILEKILKKVKKKDEIIICFLFFYLFLAKSSPSIIRAVLTENTYIILKRKIPKKEILIFIFFCLLLMNPFFLYHIGFLFSFLVSYAFILYKRWPKYKWLHTLFQSFVAFLVTIPILINQNFEIQFLAPLYNLIFIPYVTILLFPLTVFTFLIPILEPILLLTIQILEYVVGKINQIPYGVIPFGHLNFVSFCIFYCFIYGYFKNKKYLFIIFIFLLFLYFEPTIFKTNKLIMIDVGQGDSILIQSNINILIDTGGLENKDVALEILVPVLKSRGIHSIDILILTHGDFDHVGAAISLIQNFKIQQIFLNKGDYTELEEEILIEAKKKNIPVKEIDEASYKKGNMQLHFLNSKNKESENEDSLVTYTNINTYNILLMGDAGEETEKEILKKYNLPKMDILKVGHHGSKYSSTNQFLNVVDPKYAIISVGKNNLYGHPSKDVLKRLEKTNTTIFTTSNYGSIEMKLNHKLSIITCLKPATQ
jgi:competence protein ComEC